MDRFCDHISIYELNGDLYNPFGGENDINMSLVYRGECKAKLHQFFGSHSIPEDEGYTITINETDLTKINVRNIAFLNTNNNSDDKIKLTIVEVKRYERNTVIHAIALKDGDNSGDPNSKEPYIYSDEYVLVENANEKSGDTFITNLKSIIHIKLRVLHDSFGNPLYLRITSQGDEVVESEYKSQIINTNTEAYIYAPNAGTTITVDIYKPLEIEYATEAAEGTMLLPVGYPPFSSFFRDKYCLAPLKKDDNGEYTEELEISNIRLDYLVANKKDNIFYLYENISGYKVVKGRVQVVEYFRIV